MQNLIQQLFQLQGFERKTQDELELYGYCEKDRTSYWLVIHGEPKLSPEYQAKLLSDCKKSTLDPALEKNINLLVTWQTDEEDDRTKKLVHYTEEDVYFFKKHVLLYTLSEFEALQQQIETNGFDIVFRNTLSNTQTFTEYKLQHKHQEGGWQSLLFRLAIKVSAVTLQSSSKADLSSLEKNIKDNILSSSNADLLVATESSLVDTTTLRDITPEELLASMTEKLRSAGYELDC